MSVIESNITKEIQLIAGKSKATLFRNNTGMGWLGVQMHYKPGFVLLKDARPLHAGLTKGGSDLIGWKSITVTPEMVGKKIAVFAAIEVKSLKGKPSIDQVNFIQQVRASGGIAGIARSAEDAQNILELL